MSYLDSTGLSYFWSKIKAKLSNYLPLTGGTMSAPITFSTYNVIKRDVDTSYTELYGGTTYTKGAYMYLAGKDSTVKTAGAFTLVATNGTTQAILKGYPSNSLTWNGNEVLTTANGLQLTGGTLSGALNFSQATSVIRNTATTNKMYFEGGTTNANGASLCVTGGAASSEAGYFTLTAATSSNAVSLIGTPSGSLAWNSNEVLTAAGGAITGPLIVSGSTDYSIYRSNDTSGLYLSGGNGNYTHGGSIYLYGKNTSLTGWEGTFVLRANDGTNDKLLVGFPDGHLKWKGSEVLTTSSLSDSTSTTSSTTGASSTAVKSTYDLATTANTTASAALPKSGGTMTGSILMSSGNLISKNDSNLAIWAGTASDSATWANRSAYLSLCSKNFTGNEGMFVLGAYDGTNIKTLIGKPDGTLTWNGNTILTTNNGLIKDSGTLVNKIYYTPQSNNYFDITSTAATGCLTINSGTSAGSGARLLLYGQDWSDTNKASFVLSARNSSVTKSLIGKTDGTLTWVGNSILTSEHNTDTSAHSNVLGDISTIPSSDSTVIDYIDDVSESLDTLSDQVLHLTGGTMSGAIFVNNNKGVFGSNSSGAVYFCSGNASANGAYIKMYGKDSSSSAGNFYVVANNGSNSSTLTGTASGRLTWGGNEVLTSTHDSDTTAHSDIRALITTAQSTSDNCLPLSGGTLTGTLISQHSGDSGGSICSITDGIRVKAGTSISYVTPGAMLDLKNDDGSFELTANMRTSSSGTEYCTLYGTYDGTLKWNSNNIITAAGGTMTGALSAGSMDIIKHTGTAGWMAFLGGSSESNGAFLQVNGSTRSSYGGYFFLKAVNSSYTCSLVGAPNGALAWNGQGVQTTSDATLKQNVSNIPNEDLNAWAAVDWKRFKFIKDVEVKGDNNTRYHTGLIAQSAIESMTEAGGDPLLYGIFCKLEDEKDDDGNVIEEGKWTVRYTEALAMEAIYLRNELAKVKARLDALENK